MDEICNYGDCTFTQTGICILSNTPLTCPERLTSLEISGVANSESTGEAILETPEEYERFSSSLTLSLTASQKLMGKQYCKVIGILGVPGTGKTASLVSLYLLLAHEKLDGFHFKDSKSIMAFEEISRGARRWNQNNLPEQLTVHTELNDERSAGYLHLRINYQGENKDIDLLLTDLPGEWTSSLIDNNRTDRLTFLKSADRIWLTVNSEEISKLSKRKHTIHRLTILIERLVAFLAPDMPDVTVVVTHCDKTPSVSEHLLPIKSIEDNFNIKIVEIASFSSNENVVPGTGIAELINDLMHRRNPTQSAFWPKKYLTNLERNMLQFRINRE